MAEEDFEEYEENEVVTDVQLGFIETGQGPIPLLETCWNDWDGGKCGGRPIWLDPINIPSPQDIICGNCNHPMIFLLQIYSPIDDIDAAFHRSLYIFVCHRRECFETHASVKCLRCQLPRVNEFYSSKSDDCVRPYSGTLPSLCELCGCRAPHKCSSCKHASYCSREHQRLHWKHHKLVCHSHIDAVACSDGESSAHLKSPPPLLFPEYEISVSTEVLVDCAVDAKHDSVLKANIWDDSMANDASSVSDRKEGDDSEDEDDDDAMLTQNDYSKALGNEVTDPVYMRFLERVRRGGPQQVLRYIRWSDAEGPLQVSTNSYLAGDTNTIASRVSCCPHCGAPRKFEFQVMPQLLYFLKVDRKTRIDSEAANSAIQRAQAKQLSSTVTQTEEESTQKSEAGPPDRNQSPSEATAEVSRKDRVDVFLNESGEDIDWGSLDVYTCTASCSIPKKSTSSSYVEELVLMQPPISVVGNKRSIS